MKQIDEFLLFGAALLDAPRAARGLPPSSPKRGAKSRGKRAASLAVWIRGDRIAAVGPLATLRARAGRKVKRVDLGGGTLTPGFTDSHIHLVTWIRALREPWLDEQSADAIERAVRARRTSAPREEWLLLRGFVPRDWPSALRIRATLDRIAPDRPLVLHAVDGHSVWANRAALERAGIDERSPDPPGGTIERDRAGALTGFLLEEARKLMTERVERTTPARVDLADAIAKARSLGITSAHDFDRAGTWHAASELGRDRALGLRLVVSVPVASLDDAVGLGLASGFGGDRLRVGPVKMFADGTLGSATALLESPYEGSSDRGIEVTSLEALGVRVPPRGRGRALRGHPRHWRSGGAPRARRDRIGGERGASVPRAGPDRAHPALQNGGLAAVSRALGRRLDSAGASSERSSDRPTPLGIPDREILRLERARRGGRAAHPGLGRAVRSRRPHACAPGRAPSPSGRRG